MARNPFSGILCTSWFTIVLGISSIIVGIIEMCVWLAVLGVFGNISKDGRVWVFYSYGGVSGGALLLMSACGLWCGLWVCMAGVCGATMSVSQSSDKNNRTRIVVCMASFFNAIIFCPVQISLYSYMFKPEDIWFDELFLREPVWWAVALQSVGIASGVGSLIACIITIIVSLRIKPYAGAATTEWDDIEVHAVSI